MIKKYIPFINKHYLYISFIIFFLFNLPIINNLPFSDDLHHVFNYSFIRDAAHPFVYWFPWSPFFKSWGLTYSVLWMLNAIFAQEFIYYRIFNLAIHFVNHYLFRKIIKTNFNFSTRKTNFLSLLFLFNPLSILTTNWIFQIKTLLAVQFVLLILIVIHKKSYNGWRDHLKVYLLFFLGLISKICAILIPFYILALFLKKFEKKKAFILCIPLFALSTVYGLLNIKGVTYINAEVKNLSKPVPEIIIDHAIQNHKQGEFNSVKEIEVFNDISKSAKIYIPQVLDLDSFGDKHIISMQNLGRFVLYTLGLNIYYPFYEDNLKTSLSYLSYLYVLIGIIFLYILILTKNKYLLLSLFLFLPISGYFYVPYMKYSFTSDHWFYPASFAFLLGVFQLIKSKRVLILISIPILFNFSYTIYKFSNFQQLLTHNYANNQNKFILENLTQYRVNATTKDRINIYTHLLNNVDFNNQTYYKALYEVAKETNQGLYIKRHYSRFAADQIRSQNTNSLRAFVSKHNGLFPERILNLTNVFDSMYSKTINMNIRKKSLDYLK